MSAQFRNEDSQVGAAPQQSGLEDVHAGLVKLHAKVDDFFDAVLHRHRLRMQCGAGCASCCHRMPSVFPVEAWMIARGMRELPVDMAERLAKRLVKHGHGDEVSPCPMLDERRHCRVYANRPILCRSHGVPVQVPDQPVDKWSVCPLNFHAPGMRAQVHAGDVLDVERLNEILSVIDSLFQQAFLKASGLPLRMSLAGGVLHFWHSA